MPSETDCLNDALGQIGEARITDIDDGSRNANQCKTFYEPLRQAALRANDWNFARARVELAQDAAGPAFGWAYSYTLPSDCLRVREYAGSLTTPSVPVSLDQSSTIRQLPSYAIEGRKLLTNDATVLIGYTRDVTNPDEWDPLFYQYLTTHLASKLAAAISKDNATARTLLEQALTVLLPLAQAVDGQEGTQAAYTSDELTWGR